MGYDAMGVSCTSEYKAMEWSKASGKSGAQKHNFKGQLA